MSVSEDQPSSADTGCQVLEVAPNQRFVYVWEGGHEGNVGKVRRSIPSSPSPLPGDRAAHTFALCTPPSSRRAMRRPTATWAKAGRGGSTISSPSPPKESKAMPAHRTATREQWLAERLALIEAEKDLTHRSDELAPPAPGAALGKDRQEVSLRHPRRQRYARRSVQGPLAAARLPFYVRPRLHRRLPVLLGDR